MIHASRPSQLTPEERDMTFSFHLISRGFRHFKTFLPLVCTRFGVCFFLSFLFNFSSFVSNTRWRPMWNWYAGASSLGGYSAGRDSDRLREKENEKKKSKSGFLLGIATISLLFYFWVLV